LNTYMYQRNKETHKRLKEIERPPKNTMFQQK